MKWSTPHLAQSWKPSITSARAAMPVRRLPPPYGAIRGPAVMPRAVIADMPRIPRRAIDRGTRQEYPHSVHVRSHSRANNPKGTLGLFARREPAVNGGGPPVSRPRR